jgi:hypothetical protein
MGPRLSWIAAALKGFPTTRRAVFLLRPKAIEIACRLL